MSAEETKALVRRGYEAINELLRTGDATALERLAAAEFVDHNPSPGQGPGLRGVVQSFAELRSAFPDAQLSVEDMIAEGDKVATRVTFRGTHRGAFMGLAPAGKRVTQTGIDIVRVAGGKAVERWGSFDDLGLLQQLGATPAPGAAGPGGR